MNLNDLKREAFKKRLGDSPYNDIETWGMADIAWTIDYLHTKCLIVPDGYVAVSDAVLWAAWHELNAIRSRSGVPLGFDGNPQPIAEDYFSKLVDDLHDALGDKAQPWAPTNMIATARKDGV